MVYKKIFFLLIFILAIKLVGSTWQLPNEDLSYHEVAFLTSHNSHSNERDGYIQPQQFWSLSEQLANGVRGFMLDTHYQWRMFKKSKQKVYLCHGNYFFTKFILRPFKGKPMTFEESLIIFKDFLIKNPNEIITIFLENYTSGSDIDHAIDETNIGNFILKPNDWCSEKEKGWPKISWMIKNNKRLVIFNSIEESKYTHEEWSNHAENRFGELDIKKAARERLESKLAGKKKTRYLYVLNYFPRFYVKGLHKVDFGIINNKNLSLLIDYVYKQGLDDNDNFKQRYPNFIAVDYVDQGICLDVVNSINQKAVHHELRKSMFRPIEIVSKQNSTKLAYNDIFSRFGYLKIDNVLEKMKKSRKNYENKNKSFTSELTLLIG